MAHDSQPAYGFVAGDVIQVTPFQCCQLFRNLIWFPMNHAEFLVWGIRARDEESRFSADVIHATAV